jgi:hypothetical protein
MVSSRRLSTGVLQPVSELVEGGFRKLLGLYVVLFFVVAQVVAKVQFHQSPTKPIYLGGLFIILGGLVMIFWKG